MWIALGRQLTVAATFALVMASIFPMSISAQAPSAGESCQAEVEPNDRPERAPTLAGELCLAGSLVDGLDQDLFFWEVAPEDGLTTWSFTMRGIPTTITSAHVFALPDPLAFPLVDLVEVFRADSDAHLGTPPITTETRLAPGPYLVGVSRGAPGFDQEITEDHDYELRIERTAMLPPPGDVEPNDDATTATPLTGAFALTGDLAGSIDEFRWVLSEADAGRTWRIEALTSRGAYLTIGLATTDEVLTSATAGPDGSAALHDLRLAEGEYLISVREAAEGTQPYLLRAVEVTDADIDPEPNDSVALAVPLDPATLAARGHLATDGDVDRYRLDVDPGLAGRLLDIVLSWSDGSGRFVCLATEAGTSVGCSDDASPATLAGLVLAEGRYVLDVSGAAGPDDRYELRVTPGEAAAADHEAEPNDAPDTATRWDPALVMHGRASGTDIDTYRVGIDTEPALWSVDISGRGIAWVTWLLPDGTPMGSAEVAADGTRARIEDLYLIRGDHLVSIQADGDYETALTRQGSPAEGAEREPNDDSGHAETLRMGSTRIGRLPVGPDWDLYRFTLMAPMHVILRLEAPADGEITMNLAFGLEPVILATARPGEAVEEDLALAPGDYELQLHATIPSTERYSLSLEWADPFGLADDQEPNDSINEARPLPANLKVHGTARSVPDDDWYRLPALDTPDTLRMRAEGEQVSLALTDGSQLYGLTLHEDGVTYAAEGLPPGVPLYLVVTAYAEYHLTVTGDRLVPGPDPVDPPVELSLQTDVGSVAAFRREGQRLHGTLSVRSETAADIELSLDAATSQRDWAVRPDQGTVSVPAGGTISVPLTVEVPPDAWSAEPVRLTVRARDATGGQRTASLEVLVDPYAEPVDPGTIWTLPDALLGGLNVASGALGAVHGGTLDPEGEKALYDGVTPDGAGFSIGYAALPLDIDVDLAGDAPVPVAGTILHPEGIVSNLSQYPREFDLLLSDDGTSWQVALSGELVPIAVDQAFALPSPVGARFARLRIRSKYGASSGLLSLAEWKVVAAPVAAPSADALDISDPALGGHIVWMEPWFADRGILSRILDADLTRETTGETSGHEVTFLLAFQDDRAAQVTELGWVDPDGSDAAARLASVEVEISLDGPLGPWRSLGTWSLERSADGTVAPFPLPLGTWARFLKLHGPIPSTAVEQDTLELPGSLRVMERATDGEYRSVFGEWGDGRPSGPYEWLVTPEARSAGPDAGDTAEAAATLPPDTTLRDQARFGADEDWYALTVPEGQETVSFSLGAQPAVAVELSLQDRDGREIPLTLAPGKADSARWIAIVRPGETYELRVHQPPFSSVVTFDTSGSLSNWVPRIMAAVRTFTAGVEPGREAIMILPIEEEPLLEEWSDQPDALREAVDGWRPGGSSAAMTALSDASQLLADRTGIHAIFVIHDAEDISSYLTIPLWQRFARVRPVVFSVLVSNLDPAAARDTFQDWSSAQDGFYQYATTQTDMDKAFARMAAWLRRPADYTLSWATSHVEYPPSTLSVVPAEGASVPIGGGVSVELVLDTSGSMNKKIADVTRMAIAQAVLTRLVNETLPEGLPVALRTFKAGNGSCDTVLAVPFDPLDRAAMSQVIAQLRLHRKTRTPLGATLRKVGEDLAARPGPQIVVFVTDGKETCKGDPEAEVEALVVMGVEVTMNIVGFALDDPALKADMESWASRGGGIFFDAQDQESLLAGVASTLRAPFRVYDRDGALVASGALGDTGLELPPGSYRVEVLSEPPATFEEVLLAPGEDVELTVGEPLAP